MVGFGDKFRITNGLDWNQAMSSYHLLRLNEKDCEHVRCDDAFDFQPVLCLWYLWLGDWAVSSQEPPHLQVLNYESGSISIR